MKISTTMDMGMMGMIKVIILRSNEATKQRSAMLKRQSGHHICDCIVV
jgi:hypothetical protein